MVTNIQPFQFIKRTNIKEHNALGDKVNEVITVINDLNLDNVGTEIEQLQTEVSELNTDVSGNTADIIDLKSNVQQNTTDIAENTEMVQGLSSELPTSFALTLENDILTYRYNKEDGTFLDSNPVTMPYMTGDEAIAQFQPKGNYETVTGAESKYQPKGDYETVSGAAGKYQPIGDYLTEVPIGGDVIGGVKNGGNVTINADGTMNASGQGTGIDSNVLTYANNKLKSTVNGVDSNEVEIVAGGTVDAYTKAESDAKYATKSEIPDVSNFVTQVELAGDLADYMTADDVAAQYQVKGDYETVAGAAGKYQPIGNYLTEVPIGGTAIGGVKNGGNVTINSDGTMTASGGSGESVDFYVNTFDDFITVQNTAQRNQTVVFKGTNFIINFNDEVSGSVLVDARNIPFVVLGTPGDNDGFTANYLDISSETGYSATEYLFMIPKTPITPYGSTSLGYDMIPKPYPYIMIAIRQALVLAIVADYNWDYKLTTARFIP